MLFSGFVGNIDDVFRFSFIGTLSHSLGHLEAVSVAKMSVRFCDKYSAVLVAQPPRDHLEVDAGFDGVGAEVMTHTVVSEPWYAGLLGGTCHQRPGALDRGYMVRIDFGSV